MKIHIGFEDESEKEVDLGYEEWLRMFKEASWDGKRVMWIQIQKEDGTDDKIALSRA